MEIFVPGVLFSLVSDIFDFHPVIVGDQWMMSGIISMGLFVVILPFGLFLLSRDYSDKKKRVLIFLVEAILFCFLFYGWNFVLQDEGFGLVEWFTTIYPLILLVYLNVLAGSVWLIPLK